MVEEALNFEGPIEGGYHPRYLEYFHFHQLAIRPPKRDKDLYKNLTIFQQFRPCCSEVTEVQQLFLHDCCKKCFNELAMMGQVMAKRRRMLNEWDAKVARSI